MFNVTIIEKINQRQRQILVHSFIYYQLNDNVISDTLFDKFCKELLQLQEDYPTETKISVYYKEFIGFDGSTGFDLPYNTPRVQGTAMKLIQYRDEDKNE